MKKDGEIKSNLDELNRYLQKLSKLDTECAAYVVERLVYSILADLKLNSPVKLGNLRDSWDAEKLSQSKWRIFNNADYAIYVEYGVKHPLSSDPQKRANSLRYLFATGILQSNDGIVVSTYEPKSGSVGFTRRTLEMWRGKAPRLVKQWVSEWIELKRRET